MKQPAQSDTSPELTQCLRHGALSHWTFPRAVNTIHLNFTMFKNSTKRPSTRKPAQTEHADLTMQQHLQAKLHKVYMHIITTIRLHSLLPSLQKVPTKHWHEHLTKLLSEHRVQCKSLHMSRSEKEKNVG
ncbi:unnamed protein product [Ixodes persulcatus]